MNRFRFIKVRDVKTPSRGNAGDAGLDFYIPENIPHHELLAIEANRTPKNFTPDFTIGSDMVSGIVKQICIYPGGRILIPSGIKPLIEPRESMLMAANKSGLASKRGLLYTAEIVDSPYVGEIHIGIINLSREIQTLQAGEKASQFIHVPVYLTEPEEIQQEEFFMESQVWGTRGEGGFNSTGSK